MALAGLALAVISFLNQFTAVGTTALAAPFIADMSRQQTNISLMGAERNSFATELESGKWQAGANKGKALTAPEMAAEQAKFDKTTSDLAEATAAWHEDQTIIKALSDLPKTIDAAVKTLTPMLNDLQIAADKTSANTKNIDNKTKGDTVKVDDRKP